MPVECGLLRGASAARRGSVCSDSRCTYPVEDPTACLAHGELGGIPRRYEHHSAQRLDGLARHISASHVFASGDVGDVGLIPFSLPKNIGLAVRDRHALWHRRECYRPRRASLTVADATVSPPRNARNQ